MTPSQRRDLAYAPELAVIVALCATAEATCAALAAAHHFQHFERPASQEQVLAARLYAALTKLALVAAAYCEHIADLARPVPEINDIPF